MSNRLLSIPAKALDYTDSAWGALATIVPVRGWNYGLAGFDRTHA